MELLKKMRNKKILVISLSGIGNTILFTPFLNSLRENYPQTEIDFLTLNQGMADVVSGSNLVDNIFVLSKKPFRILKTIWRLRKKHYDYSVTAFPSNKWQFNMLAFLIGAKNRITHKYKCCRLRTLSFLQNKKIPAIEGIHDVEQNMNLLKVFGINPENEERKLTFSISEEDKKFAEDFLRQNCLENKFLVGIHPGCNKDNKYRRWPKEYFVKLINYLTEKEKNSLLFFGPDEVEEVIWIHNNINDKSKVFLIGEKNLKNVGALIAKCKVFISTDSGLGHGATALRIPTLAIFGPAQVLRTSPYGKYGHYISLNLPCSPCLKYPFHSTSSKIKCNRNFECLRNIKVEDVINKINEILK
ncbi:hypothetical protein DRN69_05110 [Candidatus Pacearchaeota archaeon]|nr:MAG: hypothetical protein DRN69_05110 [Candidatus Pacearchaeota archaeon]